MICKDNMPLNTTEKEGFRHFIQGVEPLYKIPGRKAITSMLDDKYNFLSKVIKEKISRVSSLTITTDVWTDTLNTKSFLGVTCHFLSNNVN